MMQELMCLCFDREWTTLHDCTSFVQDGLRGLDHACFLAHEEVAKLLTRYGASVQVASEVSKHEQHIACMLNASCKDTVGPP